MVKRVFSMHDIGRSSDSSPSSESCTVEHVDTPVSGRSRETSLTTGAHLSTMRRSKSMNALDEDKGDDNADILNSWLPSISSLGLVNRSLTQVHGLEVLKRSAQEMSGGAMASLPRSLSNSSLSQLAIHDDDMGAASALMELCTSVKTKEEPEQEQFESAPSAPAVALPSLRELLGGRASAGPTASSNMGINQPDIRNQGNMVWDDASATLAASVLGAQMVAYQKLSSPPNKTQQDHSTGHFRAAHTTSPAARSLQEATGATGGGGAPVLAGGAVGDEAAGDGKHNKYCHFCQHVKVKRATSMLACENSECARRFCDHCLKTHFNNVMCDGKSVHELVDGKWTCPICRKVCCCAIQCCENKHRHCKAYRYRQRRAEQAAKRTLAHEESRSKTTASCMMGRQQLQQGVTAVNALQQNGVHAGVSGAHTSGALGASRNRLLSHPLPHTAHPLPHAAAATHATQHAQCVQQKSAQGLYGQVFSSAQMVEREAMHESLNAQLLRMLTYAMRRLTYAMRMQELEAMHESINAQHRNSMLHTVGFKGGPTLSVALSPHHSMAGKPGATQQLQQLGMAQAFGAVTRFNN